MEQVQERFRITDLNTADWAFRELKKVEEKKEQKVEYARNQIELYKKFIEEAEKEAESESSHLMFLLQEYSDSELEKDPKFKLKTAVGSAGYRKKTTWNYGNEQELLERLKSEGLGDYIRIKEEVNKSELRKLGVHNGKVVTPDGELIEGIEVVEEYNFKVNI